MTSSYLEASDNLQEDEWQRAFDHHLQQPYVHD